MRKVLTFGITQEQQQIIAAAVSDKYDVVDVTECFTDLIANPAEAVILCPSKLSSDRIEMFNEVFGEDYDTWIIFTERPSLKFDVIYVLEHDPDEMWKTIDVLQDRYKLPEQVKSAYEFKEDILNDIKELLEPDQDLSMRSKIALIENSCTPYAYLNKLVTHIHHLPLREKVPFRYELSHILLAILLAHGLVEDNHLCTNLVLDGATVEDNKEFDSNSISYDIEWILSLSEQIRDHYRKAAQKNKVKF